MAEIRPTSIRVDDEVRAKLKELELEHGTVNAGLRVFFGLGMTAHDEWTVKRQRAITRRPVITGLNTNGLPGAPPIEAEVAPGERELAERKILATFPADVARELSYDLDDI